MYAGADVTKNGAEGVRNSSYDYEPYLCPAVWKMAFAHVVAALAWPWPDEAECATDVRHLTTVSE